MSLRLVIWEAQWAAYRDRFAAKLQTDWRIDVLDPTPEALCHGVRGADALLALALPPAARACARGLRVFLNPGAGVAHCAASELPKGCALVNCYEHETPIAEYVMMAILMHLTGIQEKAAAFREGRWLGSGRTGGEPHGEAQGQTVGLLGFGHIGQAVAARAKAFGMRVLAIRGRDGEPAAAPATGAADFLGWPADLPLLLRESDFLVIACPLTAQTRGMLGAAELALMKPSACLINIARAEVAEEAALYEALRSRRIAGAALDVWYQYPPDNHSRGHGSALPFHLLPNVLATPHFSAWTHGMLDRRIARMAETLDRVARAEPLERVVLVGDWEPEA